MGFYESISKHYDYIFPYNPTQKSFLISQSNDPSNESIIEIGCGTGNLTIELCSDYKQVYGIDLDKAMLDRALDKSPNIPNIDLRTMNMLDVDKNFDRSSFDNVFTFGNTLVHLGGIQEIGKFFESVYRVLSKNGTFSIQIINYDKILDKGLDSLPTISNDKIEFIREYKKNDQYISFNTRLTVKEENISLRNSINLFPLRKSILNKLLIESGFSNIEFFSSFNGDIYDESKLPLIVSCKKI